MTPSEFSFIQRASQLSANLRQKYQTARESPKVRNAVTWVQDKTPKLTDAITNQKQKVTTWLRGKTHSYSRPSLLTPGALEKAPPDAALLLLSLLQKEGRLLDFLQEDIHSYSDEEVGAAARIVHEGCLKVIREHLTLAPVREEPEGSKIKLEPGFDAAALRPTGNVVGEPPFTGTLVHRGWCVIETRLPKVAKGHNLKILAAAEVEL